MRPVGIGDTLHRALAKIIMRAAGDQEKTACGNLQVCAGLEADIEDATYAVGQQRLERVRGRRSDEAAGYADEEERIVIVEGLNNLSIEMAGTEDEVAEGLEAALGMKVD